MVGREVRRTVVTHGRSDVITGIVVPVETAEERHLLAFAHGGSRGIGLLVEHGVHIIPFHLVVHISLSRKGEVAGVEIICGETYQRHEGVFAERAVIHRRGFGGH